MANQEQAGAWTKAFESGKFIRKSSEFRNHITKGGAFDVESGAIISMFLMHAHGLIEHLSHELFLV